MKKSSFLLTVACSLMFLANTGCKKEKTQPPVISVNSGNNVDDPVAKAGNDTTILLPSNRAKLNGSGSYTPNNSISTYRWTKISGPGSCIIVAPDSVVTAVTDLVKGIYEFMLTITSTNGKASTDICLVRVDTVINTSPAPGTFFWISMNPHDTILNLPANTVILNASIWSITNQPFQPAIANIEWKKVAGPDNYNIQSPATLTPSITGLSDGLYAFQCKVTDTSGWSNVSYGGVINVTDTSTPGQEIIIPDQSWDAHLGEPFVRINLNLYVPPGKSVKKVFIKQDCNSSFTQVYHFSQAPGDSFYAYELDFHNGEFYMYVYYGGNNLCDEKPDLKIVY